MLSKKSLSPLLLILVFAFSASAQQPPVTASVYHDVHKIQSKNLNEERSIWVRVPLDYGRTDEKFPVVYMLDGHTPQPEMMTGIIEQQVWGQMMPQMIIVSIQNTNRTRDMTPTKTDRANSGGGEAFIKFIELEVIPLVEKNYRTQPFKIFAGHSLGGLTVVYTFATRPELFNAYIAASPVLHWDDNFVIKETEKLFDKENKIDRTMFLALGDEPNYEDGWEKFQKLLKDKSPKDFEYEFKQFKEENHASVVLRAYYWGLRKVFEGWQPPNNGTIADLERHYKKLSKRFGYEILIPEDLLNIAGYQMINAKKYDDAIKIFKTNVENYPNSSNVYDSLGEAFEKDGQLKKAKENYEKAYKIAKEQGDERRAPLFKANLDRVSEKVN